MRCALMQVAETFTFAEGESLLSDVARLDTCVTVVDAASLMENFSSLDLLKVSLPHPIICMYLAHCRPPRTIAGEKKSHVTSRNIVSAQMILGFVLPKCIRGNRDAGHHCMQN